MALVYTITLPAPGAPDVVSRELHVSLDGGTESVQPLPGNALSATVTVNEGQAVDVYLVDVDDAGNSSPNSPTLTFTASDTIPPPAPTALAIGGVTEV
jgi:hypothetical protein